ncbi:MAG: hypothetical protein ACE15D_14765 [Candidatus Eisenbacteria bacterium]|nr:hypothetical protein [Candidatus Eisenbacteria bacterium]
MNRTFPSVFGSSQHRARGGVTLLLVAAATALAVFGVGLFSLSRAEDAPAAEAILEKAVDGMGGREALAKIQNRKATGTLQIPAAGITGTLVSYSARPAKNYVLVESDATGKIESGSTGDVAWESNAMSGPSLKSGEEKIVALRDADFDGIANWKKYYGKVELAGSDSVDQRPVWKVLLTPQVGFPETWLIDKETNDLVATSTKRKSPMGDIAVDTRYSDFREVDGLRIAFKTDQVLMGGMQEMLIVLDKVEQNVEIPPGTFDLPAEIQALVEKEAAGGAAAGSKPSEAGSPTEQPEPAGK